MLFESVWCCEYFVGMLCMCVVRLLRWFFLMRFLRCVRGKYELSLFVFVVFLC